MATDDPATLPVQDVVVVTLKHPSLADAAAKIAALSGPHTAIVFVQNGIPWWYDGGIERLDPMRDLRARFDLDCCVGAVAFSAAEVIAPGIVTTQSATGDRYVLGPAGATTQAAVKVASLFSDAGINAPIAHDLRPVIWRKLMLNVAFSGPAMLTQGTVGELLAQPELAELVLKLIDEVRAVAEASGAGAIAQLTVEEKAKIAQSRHRPSILQDLLLGRPMEIDPLFNTVVDLADGNEVAVPTLRLLCALITARARSAGCYPGTQIG